MIPRSGLEILEIDRDFSGLELLALARHINRQMWQNIHINRRRWLGRKSVIAMKSLSKGTVALLATLFLFISLATGTNNACADSGQLGPAQELYRAGKYKEAIAVCDKLLKSDANIIGAHYLKAVSYHALKNKEE